MKGLRRRAFAALVHGLIGLDEHVFDLRVDPFASGKADLKHLLHDDLFLLGVSVAGPGGRIRLQTVSAARARKQPSTHGFIEATGTIRRERIPAPPAGSGRSALTTDAWEIYC